MTTDEFGVVVDIFASGEQVLSDVPQYLVMIPPPPIGERWPEELYVFLFAYGPAKGTQGRINKTTVGAHRGYYRPATQEEIWKLKSPFPQANIDEEE